MRLLLAAHLERAFHKREDLPHAFMDPAMPQRPAGETTGYHTHSAPIAGAVIQDARSWTQIQGASPGIEAAPLPETSSRHLVRKGTVARVYRILLSPGESTESHTHAAPGLTIHVTAGPVDDMGAAPAASGGQGAGAWRWRDPGYVHVLGNRGERPALVMEIDWR